MTGNYALETNANVAKANATITITDHGSDWYWAVMSIMTLATLVFAGLSFTRPRADRIFHYITASITLVAAIAYFSMASGIGQVPITVEFYDAGRFGSVNGPVTREIFYVRYIDWFVTTPLLLLDLLLTAGVPWPTILVTILMDEVMVVTGLIGALTSTSYKWGYWTFGMIAFFYVVYALAVVGRSYAKALGPNPSRTFMMCGVLTLGIWFLYPIAWGLSEGGNVIHPDSEAAFYGILDVIAKPIFGTLLLFGHRNISSADVGLNIREPGHINNAYSEKNTTAPTGVTTGPTTTTTV